MREARAIHASCKQFANKVMMRDEAQLSRASPYIVTAGTVLSRAPAIAARIFARK